MFEHYTIFACIFIIRIFNGCEVAEWCRTDILSDRIFNSHRTTIMDSFYCILFLRQLHLGFWNSQNCSTFPLAFVAGSLQGHWWGFISRNYVVWPIFCLMNVFIALKGTHFWFLFAFTAAGVVPCGGRKTSPRTSTIVQFIFYFWSFEISVNILRNQKWMSGLDSYSRQVLII